jgi:hypothetical protein
LAIFEIWQCRATAPIDGSFLASLFAHNGQFGSFQIGIA